MTSRMCPRCIRVARIVQNTSSIRQYATAAVATTPAPSIEQLTAPTPTIARHNPTQPPSYKRPEIRRTQILRQYASLLQSSPLMIFFQHSNLRSTEWVGIRRELAIALRKVDAERQEKGLNMSNLADEIRVQVIHTGVFYMALRIVEYFSPKAKAERERSQVTSQYAYDVASGHGERHALEPLLSGPVAVLSMPAVSPDHLKAALSILAPQSPAFPAPKRRVAPGLYELGVQSGLRKLLLLGARVEGQTFDFEGARWVGTINGGVDGLRGQLVAMLQSVGASVTGTLQSASSNLWLTMESRRSVLEEEQKPKIEEPAKAEEPTS